MWSPMFFTECNDSNRPKQPQTITHTRSTRLLEYNRWITLIKTGKTSDKGLPVNVCQCIVGPVKRRGCLVQQLIVFNKIIDYNPGYNFMNLTFFSRNTNFHLDNLLASHADNLYCSDKFWVVLCIFIPMQTETPLQLLHSGAGKHSCDWQYGKPVGDGTSILCSTHVTFTWW